MVVEKIPVGGKQLSAISVAIGSETVTLPQVAQGYLSKAASFEKRLLVANTDLLAASLAATNPPAVFRVDFALMDVGGDSLGATLYALYLVHLTAATKYKHILASASGITTTLNRKNWYTFYHSVGVGETVNYQINVGGKHVKQGRLIVIEGAM
jgi:hypothetical protein